MQWYHSWRLWSFVISSAKGLVINSKSYSTWAAAKNIYGGVGIKNWVVIKIVKMRKQKISSIVLSKVKFNSECQSFRFRKEGVKEENKSSLI